MSVPMFRGSGKGRGGMVVCVGGRRLGGEVEEGS